MAIAPTTTAAPEPATGTHDWPSEGAGWYALAIIVLTMFLTFFDATVFSMLAEKMKVSFGLSDSALGFLLGPAGVIAFVFVGIPLSRLVDIYPRKYVLAAGIALTGVITALGGVAQNFGQMIGSRLFVGAGGSAHGPGSYSLLADAFRPVRIPLVFALIQFGFVLGTSLGTWGGGRLIAWTATMPETIDVLGITIFNWQLILIVIGLPGLLAALLFLMVREPPRRSPPDSAKAVPADAPLGRRLMAAWRVPFITRTHGWTEAEIGNLLGPLLFVASIIGIVLGGVFVSWMNKRYKDGNIRACALIFTCTTTFAIATPLMPSGELALGCMAMTSIFGLAGAPAQNAAIQRIAPNEMRGQVTALYLFMFTFFGAMGSFVIGSVSTYVIGDPAKLWQALLIVAGLFMPVATLFMWRAIKPYGAEVVRLEALGR